MNFKHIIIVLCIGVAWAQTEPSLTDTLNNLSPELQGKVDEKQVTEIRNKTVAAFKKKCEENAGPDAYPKAERAFVDFTECLKALVDPEKLKQEIEDAKPHGAVDEVFKKYCHKKPQFKSCFMNITETIKPCFSAAERSNLKTVYNVSEQLAEFACFKEGDRFALFISENGPECIQEKQAEIEQCLNTTLGTAMNFKADNMSLDNIPTISFGEKECGQLGELQVCVVAALETCSAPTSANIVESLFKYARKATPCKELPDVDEIKNKNSPNSARGLVQSLWMMSAVAVVAVVS